MRYLSVGCALLCIAGIPYLGLNDEFYTPPCSQENGITQTEYIPGDGQIITASGKYSKTAKSFFSTGNEGALVWGPFVTLPPGRYRIEWFGAAAGQSEPTFEVYSLAAGLIKKSKSSIKKTTEHQPLQSIEFETSRKIVRAEFRLLISSTDNISVNRIRVTGQDCGNGSALQR